MTDTDNRYDVLIIGAGVVGCAAARELSRYRLDVAVLERELDVSMGASSRNSGVLHSGIHYTPATLRAQLNVQGNALMPGLCKELKVKTRSTGKLTVARDETDLGTLHRLREQGEANGVPGLEILGPDAMQQKQPGVEGIAALWSPTTGIICPYGLTIALAENALQNGVDFYLGREVTGISRSIGGFRVRTASGERFETGVLINAAGLFCDRIARMVGIGGYRVHPCRGEYLVLDKRLEDRLSTLVYPAPRRHAAGLGIHLTRTVDGNILIGPSSEYVDDPEDTASTADIVERLKQEGHALLPGITSADVIRSFSGLRAKQAPPEEGGFRDFVIERREDVPGFINLVGIESPGLTSSPAIARMVKDLVSELVPLREKRDFQPERPGDGTSFFERSPEEKADLVAQDPDYGEIVCRCEQVTRKEVLDAVQNPLGVRTLAAVKFRTRAMMGRCQGGFCLPRLVRILERDFGYRPEDYLLFSPGSHLFEGRVREEANTHA